MASARARTQPGAALCVPAERLARTPTQATPAASMPSSAAPENVLPNSSHANSAVQGGTR